MGLAMLVMAVALALGHGSRPAYAAEEDVAQIGDTTYATLADAVNDVPTDGTETTIKLIADESVSSRLNLGLSSSQRNVILDLNGHVVTVTNNASINVQASTLTVRDSSSTQSGAIQGEGCANNLIQLTNSASGAFKLEGGTISTDGAVAVRVARAGAQFQMTGGTIEAPTPLYLQYVVSATITGGRLESTTGDTAINMINANPTLVAGPNLVIGSAGVYDEPVIEGAIAIPQGDMGLQLIGGTIGDISGTLPEGATLTSHFASDISDALPAGVHAIQQDGNWVVRELSEEDAAAVISKADGSVVTYANASLALESLEDGDTLKLQSDVTAQLVVADSITATVDLNGHTLSSDALSVVNIAASNTNLTFTNGDIVSTSEDQSATVAMIFDDSDTPVTNATVNFENVDLRMENSGGAGIQVYGNNTNNTVTLDGCTLTVPDDVMGIYFPPAESTLNLIDTQISAGTGVGLKGGTLNISGGTEIHAKGANDPAGVPEGGGIAETGAAIYVDGGYVNREVAVNVQGGTFTSAQGSAIQELVSEDRPESVPVTIEVAGGSFDDASIAGYLTPNAAVVATADGTYDVYPTEDEALASGGAYRVEDAQGNVWFFRDAETAEQFAAEQGTGSAVQTVSHTVTFHDCLESTEDEVANVLNGDAVARPATDPTCEGWKFLGWYELVDGQYAAEPYDFATPVTGDLVLYAKWEKLPDGDPGQGDQVETPTDPDQKPSDEQKPGADQQTPTDEQKPADQQKPTADEKPADQQPAGEKGDQLAQTSDPTSAAPVVAAGLSGLAAIGASLAARLRGRRRE